MNLNKTIRTVLTFTLTSGVVLFIGFLSFAGALLIYNSLPFALITFLLSAGIESLVYGKNIKQAAKKIFKNDYLEDAILQKTLKQLLKTPAGRKNHFLNDYEKQSQYAKTLKNTHANAQQIKKAKIRLKKMRAHFKAFIMDKENPATAFDSRLSECISSKEKRAILADIRRKKMYTRLVWIVNITVGLCSGLVGISVLKSGFAAFLAVLPVIIPGVVISNAVFALALLGALGYIFLIHNMITDMIQNDTLRLWKDKIIALFQPRENESSLHHGLKVSGILLLAGIIVGFGIFSTIATAGTWWYAAKTGAHALPYLSIAATWIRDITVPVTGITNFLFMLNNSFESVMDVTSISLSKTFKHVENTCLQYYHKENIFQFVNPFRAAILIISIPFNFVLFVGHLFSEGLMGDKLGNIPEVITASINSVSGGLTDTHYLLPEKSGHQHADLPGMLLNVVLLPLYLLAGCWDSAFSFCTAKTHSTPWQSLKKMFFGLPHEHAHEEKIRKPSFTSSWKTYERVLKNAEKTAPASQESAVKKRKPYKFFIENMPVNNDRELATLSPDYNCTINSRKKC